VNSQYYLRNAAAFARGRFAKGKGGLPHDLWDRPLDDLSEDECSQLVSNMKTDGTNLRSFKRAIQLSRVTTAVGILKGLNPSNLLDVGSGRGVSLWPIMEAFPAIQVTAVDSLLRNIADLDDVHRGGIKTLRPSLKDCTKLSFEDRSFDVTTMLEVLEHIPDANAALREVVRVSSRFVLLSVPSTPDDNPEHIHFFKEADLRRMFGESGVTSLKFQYVPNHMLVLANLGR
jgi:ubiquinone/menaquinone biosynthesis C-methylase UbiE